MFANYSGNILTRKPDIPKIEWTFPIYSGGEFIRCKKVT